MSPVTSSTIAIPTYNRSRFLKKSLKTALNQTIADFEVLIIDNHSTDDTKSVVEEFMDDRIVYVKNRRNIGMIGNWNRCIELATGKYILVLGDDDMIEPTFLQESVEILDKHPKVGFTFSHCYKVDKHGERLSPWGYFHFQGGYIRGVDYLLETATQGCCLTNSSTVLLRKEIFENVGCFNAYVPKNTFDFNMWLRIASEYDTYFIDKYLTNYSIHSEQVSELHWRGTSPTGLIGARLEILQSLAKLLRLRTDKAELIATLINDNQQELFRLLGIALPGL